MRFGQMPARGAGDHPLREAPDVAASQLERQVELAVVFADQEDRGVTIGRANLERVQIRSARLVVGQHL